MSPDVVAASLAKTELVHRLEGVMAYHLLDGGGPTAMLPKEWDGIEADLQSLSDVQKASEKVDGENYPEWRRESVIRLPASVFIWRDEFERAFARAYDSKRLNLIDERTGDRDLNFSPFIPPEMLRAVTEGFPTLSGDVPSNEPPEQRRERLRRNVLEEKKKGTKAFLQTVADRENISVTRVKQLIKADPVPDKNTWKDLETTSRQTTSKRNKT